jgi:hypothetical protein
LAKAKKEATGTKGLFDFITAITTDQSMDYFDSLTDADKKSYKGSRYMIHRFLSMNPHYAPIVNLAQKYTMLPDRSHYQLLTGILPRGKQYNKYIKGAKDEKYEKWLVDLVVKHYGVSKVEAIQYIEIYYKHDKKGLKDLCEMYAVDKKDIKKAKL